MPAPIPEYAHLRGLRVDVVREVYSSFLHALRHNTIAHYLDQQREFASIGVLFPCDGCVWKATAESRSTMHCGRDVLFTTVTLFHDRFFIGHCEQGTDLDCAHGSEEIDDIISTMVDSFHLSRSERGRLCVSCDVAQHQFELAQWSSDGSKCIVAKFEYGPYEFRVNKRSYDRRALTRQRQSAGLAAPAP